MSNVINNVPEFTPVGSHDNSTSIDGTPGSPHVQVMGVIYRCSPIISTYVAKLARARANKDGPIHGNPHYLQVTCSNYPLVQERFDKSQPDADYEYLVFMRGNTTNTWYCQSISF